MTDELSPEIVDRLMTFGLDDTLDLFPKTNRIQWYVAENDRKVAQYINEFWTARQRQASSIHEISYRACFKPQLPRFFINLLTKPGEVVYDPFCGRGTTPIEAGLMGRRVIANDANPLSRILTRPRLFPPKIEAVEERLAGIPFYPDASPDLDLSMFFHPGTLAEIVSLRNYLADKAASGREDDLDQWIRMTATNRLTGHSKGFFSVYTLPPNQAVSQASQIKINERLGQKPEYRDVRAIILKKTKRLLRDINPAAATRLNQAGRTGLFFTQDAAQTKEIKPDSVHLTVTSPPFLNQVQYPADNWLRWWFNNISAETVARGLTMAKTIQEWTSVMGKVFQELHRLTVPGGWVAFEVGEIRSRNVKLDEHVAPLGSKAWFHCQGVVINEQRFTKTSNIWGVNNNDKGTNTNRVVLFQK